MNEKMRQLLDQISKLEEEFYTEVQAQQSRWFYSIVGKRVEFERTIRDAHRRLRVGVLHWFMTVRPQNYLTAPIIYGMIIPIVFFDLCLEIYHRACFPIYGIARVRRSDYIVFDLQHLAYLNWIEKFDCLYCSYGNGLIAYAHEIFARTEQYFCPIKHARRVKGLHARYAKFIDYGDAEDLHVKFEEIRVALIREGEKDAAVPPPADIKKH